MNAPSDSRKAFEAWLARSIYKNCPAHAHTDFWIVWQGRDAEVSDLKKASDGHFNQAMLNGALANTLRSENEALKARIAELEKLVARLTRDKPSNSVNPFIGDLSNLEGRN